MGGAECLDALAPCRSSAYELCARDGVGAIPTRLHLDLADAIRVLKLPALSVAYCHRSSRLILVSIRRIIMTRIGSQKYVRHPLCSSLARLTVLTLVSFMLAVSCVEASTRNIGDTCSYAKNCQSHVVGAGPSWENDRVTCAVPASQAPETCGSNEPNRSNFGGYVCICFFSC